LHDGNTASNDGCTADCRIVEPDFECLVPGSPCTLRACWPDCPTGSICGDGITAPGWGEQCDDGVNDGDYGECAPGCLFGPYCGDGLVQLGEACDDGNGVSGDGCSPWCRLEE
jgi:cysteine-rich repeat protein